MYSTNFRMHGKGHSGTGDRDLTSLIASAVALGRWSATRGPFRGALPRPQLPVVCLTPNRIPGQVVQAM